MTTLKQLEKKALGTFQDSADFELWQAARQVLSKSQINEIMDLLDEQFDFLTDRP